MTSLLAEGVVAIGRSADLSIIVKATLAVILGLAATRMARRARASTRHLLLALTFGALLTLPVVLAVVPSMAIRIPISRAGSPAAPVESSPAPVSAASPGSVVSRSTLERSGWSLPTWPNLLRAAWLTAATLLLVSLGGAAWRLGRMRRRGLPWPHVRAAVRTMIAEAGMRSNVEVLLHEDIVAPLTCGCWRPTILLPSDAPQWSEADLRRALVHELEHVRRADWAVELVARATCAAYWFHPLVWVTLRQLSLEAERACDDAVLQRAEQADYAEQLVQLARRLSKAPAQPILAMANRSDLSTRVSAILDTTQRRGRLGLVPATAAVAAAAVILFAIAPVRAVAVPSSSGASVAAQGSVGAGRDQRRRRHAPLDRALLEASEDGDLDGMAALLGAGADVNGQLDGDGSPLIGAARSGRLAAVRLLLDHGADPDMIVRGDGSPLVMAAREGHAEVVDLLLDRGASIDQIAPGDENALIQASGAGHLHIVKLLVARGADVNARVWVDRVFGRSEAEWRTPLTMARKGRHEAVVAYLLSVGARD